MGVVARRVVVLLWVSACSAPPVRVETQSDPSSAGRNAYTLALLPASAELFRFDLEVAAEASPDADLLDCIFRVGTRSVAGRAVEGRFVAHLDLEPGPNQVMGTCRTRGGRDVVSASQRYDVRIADRPRAVARVERHDDRLVLSASQSSPSPRRAAALESFVWSRQTQLDGPFVTIGTEREQAVIQPPRTSATYQLVVTDAAGERDSARIQVVLRSDQVTTCEDSGTRKQLFADSILYGVHPPRFGTPPLRSVTDRLPVLAELGVNVIWLAPVFESERGDFGYAVEDHFRVRPEYGSAEDLKALVRTAHRGGQRVILDLVPNHTSVTHRYFQQTQRLGRASHYFDFYQRSANGRPRHYFDWENLPNLDYDNREVQRWMTKVAQSWMREFDVDGYRVDAVWGIRERKPEFLRSWLQEIERIRPCAWMLAEAPAHDRFYVEHGFDFAYDWGPELGHWAFESVFTGEPGIAKRFAAVLRDSGAGQGVVRFLNNNDTGERFVTRHGLGLTRVATVALFTLPGVPSLYSFDEVGAEYEPYAAPEPIRMAPHPELFGFHKELIALRRALPELQQGDLEIIPTVGDGDAMAFARHAAGKTAIVVLNFGATPTQVSLQLERSTAKLPSKLRDALHPQRTLSAARPNLVLQAHDYAVLVDAGRGG